MQKRNNFLATHFLKICFITLITSLLTNYSFATKEARSTSMDSRLKVMAYQPNDVFKYVGYYGYQGSIEFETGETVDTITLGDTTGWQIIPAGNRIFLKPIETDAATNMTLITNKRLYFFELHAEKPTGLDDPGLTFAVKFLYPDDNINSVYIHNTASQLVPDLSTPDKYNFNYKISGSDLIAPIKIFDDSKFTYFEFRNKTAPIPAIFEVDTSGNESIINYQILGNYISVETVATQFTLRYGDEVTCVFNEVKPFK